MRNRYAVGTGAKRVRAARAGRMQDPDPRLAQAGFVYADVAKAAGFQERQLLKRSTRIIQQKLGI